MHFCVLRWPSWLGRQTHRVFEQIHWRRHLRHLEVAGSDPVRSMYTWGEKPPFLCRFSNFFACMKNFGSDTGGIASALL